ncbi:hypothetical protein CHS0354_016569 [Potamilus streckersoni]|uniref:SKICH domain-containing protein n=1 Tax=Potamilus streckersoni TaxID=2493646 RepID=A0AAE0WGV3_9BIVA|nr:hypothetical protein CHS0354_016569 [Potamilus streckersoni]
MSDNFDFDIDAINPQLDLVLFENIPNSYPWGRNVAAIYTLGQNLIPLEGDWIGIFQIGWRDTGDYITFKCASLKPHDSLNPARRGVLFTADEFKVPPDRQIQYQFLYLSDGDNIVGVSTPFRILIEHDIGNFHLDILMREPVLESTDQIKPRGKRYRDHFHVIKIKAKKAKSIRLKKPKLTLHPQSMACKRKYKKVTVMRDHQSLTDASLVSSRWAYNMENIFVHPVMQEYQENKEKAVIPICSQVIPIFDVARENKIQMIQDGSAVKSSSTVQAIEYLTKLSILPGPESFLLGITNSSTVCPNCNMAKSFVQLLLRHLEETHRKVHNIEKELSTLTKTNQEEGKEVNTDMSFLESCLCQSHVENMILQAKISGLKAAVVAQSKHKQKVQTAKDLTSKPVDPKAVNTPDIEAVSTPDIESIILFFQERGFTALVKEDGKEQIKLYDAVRKLSEKDGWFTKESKRTDRLLSSLANQGRLIESLRQNLKNQETQLTNYKAQTDKLRKQLQEERENTSRCVSQIEQLNLQLKNTLQNRGLTNEWRQYTYKLSKSTAQPNRGTVDGTTSRDKSPAVKSKTKATKQEKNQIRKCQFSQILNSEREQHFFKLHKEPSQVETCQTCRIKFPAKTDPRVIEEHLVFHEKYSKNMID